MIGLVLMFSCFQGGVGKTTISSALAIELSSTKKTLIVSTDPAHSLGDCLDQELSNRPLPLNDAVTQGNLYAQEIDASSALAQFRETLAGFDVANLADALQVSPEILESLGLKELSGVLNNPPPGLDELVALSNVFDEKSDFEVVVVDTAPTGHTLRLLALPQFLDGLLGKLIRLRMKLSSISSTLEAFMGSQKANQRAQMVDDALSKLETFRKRMSRLRSNLQNPDFCRFVVVTIPTVLGVSESKRLVDELNKQQVSVTDIVVNQCADDSKDSAATKSYYERRYAGQQREIDSLQDRIDKVSSSPEYKQNGSSNPIGMTKVPFFDVELVGPAALGYVGNQVFRGNDAFDHLLQQSDGSKVVICGGKGGVGKTTTSASLAVTMAAEGHKVALISTDPAHSLGDAVDLNLKGGDLQDCPLIGVPGDTGTGSLSVLEIDPAKSLGQFKGIVDQLVGTSGAGDDTGLQKTFKEIQEIFDTLPAGTDEVVALAKIVNLVKKGGFDRIVLDTAPTGHTLRMLSTPGFIADLIERLIRISDKINSNAAVRMFLSTRTEDVEGTVEASKSKLLSFQFQMYDLEDLFADAESTEFLIVTVPTELAIRESARLLNDLTFDEMPIKVRNVVVNQVLETEQDVDVFLSHVSTRQKASLTDLENFCRTVLKPPEISQVPFLDTEPRGVYGLKVLGDELLKEASVEAAGQ